MGSTKKEQYPPQFLKLAKTAKAIGHPARITILRHLSETGYDNNREFMHITQLSESTVYQHLQELKYAGFIREGYIGNDHFYFINHTALEQISLLKSILHHDFRDTGS